MALATDSWPANFKDTEWSLTKEHLAKLGNPILLPTPSFFICEALGFDPVDYSGFAGYEQKAALLQVYRAIMGYTMGACLT